ncbi:28103_t:CDS:2, partial [Dentiscutata erythropus]
LKKFASKLYFYDKPEQIPIEYQLQDYCIICNKVISSDLYEPIIIWTCKHLSHWSCMISKDGCPCENEEEIEISADENVESAARALMQLSQDDTNAFNLEGSNEEIRELTPKKNKPKKNELKKNEPKKNEPKRNEAICQNSRNFQASNDTNMLYDERIDERSPDFQLTDDSEETISETNSSSDMELSPLKSKQSQKEINLVSLEPDSQEINLVSLEPNSQESQGSSKQLPNYPVSAKQLPNYPVSSKNSNKKIPMDEFIKKLTTASSDNMYVFVNESAEEDSIEEDSIAKKLAQLFATACGSE